MNYLLDTCVVSEFVRPRPDAGVVTWLGEQHESSLFLSVLTIGEIHKGISKLTDEARRARLAAWVETDLRTRFEGRILDIDVEVCRVWGQELGQAERRGHKLPVIDSLLAATAALHDQTIVSRNVRDFERCGAEVINPWSA